VAEADETDNEATFAEPIAVSDYLIGTWGLIGLQGAPGAVSPRNSEWTFHANGTYDFFFWYPNFYDLEETRDYHLTGSTLHVEWGSVVSAILEDTETPLTMSRDRFSFRDADGDRWTYRRM